MQHGHCQKTLFFYLFSKGEEVRNVKWTSNCDSSHYDSWKDFWIDNTKRKWPEQCRVWYCTNPAEVGAHVKIQDENKKHILPICKKCNNANNDKKMRVNAKSLAVPLSEEDATGTGNCS